MLFSISRLHFNLVPAALGSLCLIPLMYMIWGHLNLPILLLTVFTLKVIVYFSLKYFQRLMIVFRAGRGHKKSHPQGKWNPERSWDLPKVTQFGKVQNWMHSVSLYSQFRAFPRILCCFTYQTHLALYLGVLKFLGCFYMCKLSEKWIGHYPDPRVFAKWSRWQ